MKKIVSLVLACGLIFTSQPLISQAASNDSEERPVEVNVNGKFISMDVHPIMDNNRLFIPIRFLSSMGISYSWNPSSKIATVKNKNGEYLKITVGSTTAYKADQPLEMDQAAKSIDGRVLVPIRFVSEALGYHINYEAIRKIVFVNANDYEFDMKMIDQDDLLSARRAAISLPITTDFKPLGLSGPNNAYSFPFGRADVYYFMDGRNRTFVEIKDGKAIAIGQYNDHDRSRTTGKVPPNMVYDTDPIMEPYNKGNVLFMENSDGTATAVFNDENSKRVEFKTKINVYSEIIQELPGHR
jgi:hypothetical protein